MYLNEYYWDVLCDKYDITTNSGFSRAESALGSWFRKQHKVSLVNFDVTFRTDDSERVPLNSEIQIEVPADRFGIPSGLSRKDFVNLVDGPGLEKYDNIGLKFVNDLFDTNRILQGWDMQQHPTEPNIIVITYFLG
jgi:hypothetical protein